MAQNIILLDFQPCEPAPVNGYKITYRPLGSDDDYRTWPNVFTSPVEIIDNNDPPGTSYEGLIQGDCGNGLMGVPVP